MSKPEMVSTIAYASNREREKMKKMLCLLVTATTLSAPEVFAVTQKFNIDLSADHTRGSFSYPLKNMINSKYGRGLLKDYKLAKVVISAKSKNGKGDANLSIGHSETYPEQVPGQPESFSSDSAGFYNIVLKAPLRAQRQRAPWKLHLKGNIKLNSIKAVTKFEPSYPYGNVGALSFNTVKKFKVDKIVGDKKKIKVGNNFKAIQLTAKGKVKVTQVKVKFQDGQVVYLDELQGKVKGPVSFKFNRELSKKVQFIEVSAVSTNLFGSRGELQISTANKKVRPTRPTRPSRPRR